MGRARATVERREGIPLNIKYSSSAAVGRTSDWAPHTFTAAQQ